MSGASATCTSRLVAVGLLLLTLAGCRSTHASARARESRVIILRPLPPQGLVDEDRHGVALRDLHGRMLVRLRAFAVYPTSASAQASLGYELLIARLSVPMLHGPHGWYRLDVGRHALVPVRRGRLPLAGGATVVAHGRGAFTIERRGRAVLRTSAPMSNAPLYDFRILSPRLVQAKRTLLDVVTGRRWKLPPNCLASGFHGRTPIVACGLAHGAEAAARMVFEEVLRGGVGRRITQPVDALIPEASSVSPDGTWVAVEGANGCAASYVYVAPARGGVARIVYRRPGPNLYDSNYSELLGWSRDGRLVVLFTPPHCDEPYGPQHPPRGVYLVDPRTLARILVARDADAMWSN
jgi:hypothetical protein